MQKMEELENLQPLNEQGEEVIVLTATPTTNYPWLIIYDK